MEQPSSPPDRTKHPVARGVLLVIMAIAVIIGISYASFTLGTQQRNDTKASERND